MTTRILTKPGRGTRRWGRVLGGIFSACKSAMLDVLSPPMCPACDAPLAPERILCAACGAVGPPVFDELSPGVLVVASARYGGPLARAIARFKYAGRPELARPLAESLVGALATANLHGKGTFVPVPLHARKLARRGYNQSALLAAELSRIIGWPLRARALARRLDTVEQAGLTRAARLENVASALVHRERFDGGHVVLVDDVVTTGATASACVNALLAAGATKVTIAAVARATVEEHSVRAGHTGAKVTITAVARTAAEERSVRAGRGGTAQRGARLPDDRRARACADVRDSDSDSGRARRKG